MKLSITGLTENYIFIALVSTILFAWPIPKVASKTRTERADLIEVFQQYGVVGTFTLYNSATKHMIIINPERAAIQLYPASTFKIANSLIALETNVVKDEMEVIPFGGGPQRIKVWEQDMSMRQAIKVSNVPVFQELARRIGINNYNSWLQKLDYGNQQVGMDIETFWLEGPLKISAIEHVRFLATLAKKELAISTRSQEIVADIVKLETKGNRILFGKTGWSSAPSPQIGWFVGWVENERGIFSFALNIDINTQSDVRKRKSVAKKLLEILDIY